MLADARMTAARLSVADYETGVRARDRVVLARAITLVESDRDDDRAMADALLEKLMPHTGGATRVGVTGVPGVGKSTLLDALGVHLVDRGERVAVLAVDPSSTISGGSILGDKTRMPKLSTKDEAFIRPSPSATTLGGVARRTRETMLVCEAAGFDVVIVETVGVGQSETAVASMVDTFVLLALPGSGDELQGIKKGIVELADVIAVNKADGANEERAKSAMRELKAAVGPKTPMLMTSGLSGAGIPELWTATLRHRAELQTAGLEARRREQRRAWFGSIVDEELARALRTDPALRSLWTALEADVVLGKRSPSDAARALIVAFRGEK